jgi:hypothetical protein
MPQNFIDLRRVLLPYEGDMSTLFLKARWIVRGVG